MSGPVAFYDPLAGLKLGITTVNLKVEGDFFQCFPDSPVQSRELDLELDLDKAAGPHPGHIPI